MLTLLTRRWPLVLINGGCATVLALLIIGWRSITPSAVASFFSIYCLINGAVAIAVARGAKKRINRLRREFLTIGFLSFFWSGIAFISMNASMEWLAIMMAGWAMPVGIVEVWTALEIRKVVPRERLFLLIGLSSVFLNFVLAALVFSAVAAIPLAFSAIMAIRGGLFVGLAFKQLGYRLISRLEATQERHSASSVDGSSGLVRLS